MGHIIFFVLNCREKERKTSERKKYTRRKRGKGTDERKTGLLAGHQEIMTETLKSK